MEEFRLGLKPGDVYWATPPGGRPEHRSPMTDEEMRDWESIEPIGVILGSNSHRYDFTKDSDGNVKAEKK